MTEVHKPGIGAIFGIVTEEGIAKDNSPVYLYDMRRWEGAGKKKLLARRFTRPDGGFEFAGLNTNYGDYMVMVTDEDGEEPKNALVQDRVNPIPAHSGSGQLAEWYVRVMRDGAITGFIAWPVYADGEGVVVPRALFGRPTQSAVSGQELAWPPNADAPPEVPNMASLGFNPVGWGPICIGGKSDIAAGGGTFELILDLDTVAAQANSAIIPAVYSGSNADQRFDQLTTGSNSNCCTFSLASHTPLTVIISPTKQLTVYTTTETRFFWSRGHSIPPLGTFDLSAFSGVQYITVVHTDAASVKLYVAGVEVYSIAHTVTSIRFNGLTAALGFVSADGVTSIPRDQLSPFAAGRINASSYTLSLAIYYDRPLSAAEVLDHYKALYNNDLVSPVSGYAREVFTDTPHMYWRMDDFDAVERTSFASDVTKRNANTGLGYTYKRLNLVGNVHNVDPVAPSPIAGRSAVGVVHPNGNHFNQDSGGSFGWLFRNRGSLSCWTIFNLATPAVAEFIAEFHQIGSDQPYFEVSRTASNQIQVRVWEGSILNTYTFGDYIPPNAAWQYIAITIDKTGEDDPLNGLLRLYVGDENTAPVLVQTLLIPLTSLYTTAAFPASATHGVVSRVRTMRQLTGSVCELAVFPEILTSARIEAHWNARTVV